MPLTAVQRSTLDSLSDEQIVARVLDGETALYEIIMRRYNQRLYRAARAIVRNDAEAEDIMQDAYVRAFEHLAQFAGRAKFSTWLTRIAIHEALARAERQSRFSAMDTRSDGDELIGDPMENFPTDLPSPEKQASQTETRALLERCILALPPAYRAVVMLRDVEGLNTAEVAEMLALTDENVKVRLHRARALLRRELFAIAGDQAPRAFAFNAVRCDRIVAGVFARIVHREARSCIVD